MSSHGPEWLLDFRVQVVWHQEFSSLIVAPFFVLFFSFIENYGTHIVTSATIGGRDVVYIRQHQSSPLSASDIDNDVKEIWDQRFHDSKSQPSSGPLKYKDKASILRIKLLGTSFIYQTNIYV